jgi:hypothetical protein
MHEKANRPHGVFTPWRYFGGEANDFLIMKSLVEPRNASTRMEVPNLTLGELIARTYSACGEKDAPNILHLAMEAKSSSIPDRMHCVSQSVLPGG